MKQTFLSIIPITFAGQWRSPSYNILTKDMSLHVRSKLFNPIGGSNCA